MTVEKLLPQNVEAEAGVLGSLLIDPEAVVQVADFLRAEDFYRETHRVIFQAIVDLYEDGEPADLIMLTDELQRLGKLEEIGGVSYVSSLANQVPTSANVEHYARIVERTAILRRLIHAAGQIAAVAYNEPDATTALEQAEKLVFNVARGRTEAGDVDLGEAAFEFLDKLQEVQRRYRSGQIVGFPTGLNDVDRLLGGLQLSDFIVLAARPGVGKTSLALTIAQNGQRVGLNTLIFSLEMSNEQLVARMLSMESGVDQQKIRLGSLSDDEFDAVAEAAERLRSRPGLVTFVDVAGLSLTELRSRARRMILERQYDLIIIDYLQLMRGSGAGASEAGYAGGSSGYIGRRYSENRQQEISEISRGLKEMAKEFNLPVLALSQLSRAVEQRQDKKPQLSDLRESGAIEQDSDVVMFIYREKEDEEDIGVLPATVIDVAKHRNGPVGEARVMFVPSTTRYRDLNLVYAEPNDGVAPNYGAGSKPAPAPAAPRATQSTFGAGEDSGADKLRDFSAYRRGSSGSLGDDTDDDDGDE